MRVLFLVSDAAWSARARAFVLAARGLVARGHDVMVACEAECPIQVRAASSAVPVVALRPDASAAGDTWQLRRAFQEKGVDVVFVHTDEEHLIASSALRLRGGACRDLGSRAGQHGCSDRHPGGDREESGGSGKEGEQSARIHGRGTYLCGHR